MDDNLLIRYDDLYLAAHVASTSVQLNVIFWNSINLRQRLIINFRTKPRFFKLERQKLCFG